MCDISIIWLNADVPLIKPVRERLGKHLCAFYSMSLPKDYTTTNNARYYTSKIPALARKVAEVLARLRLIPSYYAFIWQHKALDYVFATRIANDKSRIVYAHCTCYRTIKKSKAKGKTVITMAGNSEPMREYNLIMHDYKEFGIRSKYIYGNLGYQRTIYNSLSIADRVISISNVSLNSFKNSEYDINKFVLIPLTGTDFSIQRGGSDGKPKAFISTAFHNFIKGTQRLLLAWKQAKIEGIPLIIVGRLCEDIQEFIIKYGPFDNVQFMGYVPGSLSDFYQQYDAVGVLLSLSEGAVRTTPELMSFGFPMIVSKDATCDVVEDAQNGFVVNPFDENEIVSRLRWFAEDWGRTQSMNSNVMTSVSHRTVKDFSYECADYLISLIN